MENLYLFSLFDIDYGSILYLESSSPTGYAGVTRRWSRGTKTLGTRETTSSPSFFWRIGKCTKFARTRSSLRHCPTASLFSRFIDNVKALVRRRIFLSLLNLNIFLKN